MIQMHLDNVLVLPDKPEGEKVTQSGLIIKTDMQEVQPTRGTVVHVGDGTYQAGVWIKTLLKAGDKVMFKPYTGYKIEDDNTEYLVFKEPDIIGVFK